MAMQYIGMDRGAIVNDDSLTVGTSTTATLDIEVRIDDTVGWTSLELDDAMERIQRYMVRFLKGGGV